MSTEVPLLLDPAPPVEAPPELPPGSRMINGRIIRRDFGGAVPWMELVTVPTRDGPRQEWQPVYDPRPDVAALDQEQVGWRELDPREPDDEHDEYEKLLEVSTYFAAKFAAQFKIKPREPLPGLPLGKCVRSLGTARANLGDDALRALLRLHASGDWGQIGTLADVTLDDDMRWCPPLFGLAICNAIAIERGAGVVCSAYPRVFEKTRGVERIKVVTMIGQASYIYIPSRDCLP